MISRCALGLFFILAGAAHFLWPAPYLMIVPRILPWPGALVAVSGAAEIAGGLGVFFRATRRAAGWSLIALLVAIFPANVQAISSGMMVGGHALPSWALWARLPFQIVSSRGSGEFACAKQPSRAATNLFASPATV